MPRVAVRGELLLERGDLGAEDELAGRHHAPRRVIELVAELGVGRWDVEEWDSRGRHWFSAWNGDAEPATAELDPDEAQAYPKRVKQAPGAGGSGEIPQGRP